MPQANPRTHTRLGAIVVAASLALAISAPTALAAEGGSHGPCLDGTALEGKTLGEDVSYVAKFVGTPLPQVFAFEDGPPPMPPGQLMKYAREVGLC